MNNEGEQLTLVFAKRRARGTKNGFVFIRRPDVGSKALYEIRSIIQRVPAPEESHFLQEDRENVAMQRKKGLVVLHLRRPSAGTIVSVQCRLADDWLERINQGGRLHKLADRAWLRK